jgi:hypothetical protein
MPVSTKIPVTWANALPQLLAFLNFTESLIKQNKLRGLSLRANYTDQATDAYRRS